MWWRKKIEPKLPEIKPGQIWIVSHDNPFVSTRSMILEVKPNYKGELWVRYGFIDEVTGKPYKCYNSELGSMKTAKEFVSVYRLSQETEDGTASKATT